MLWESKSCRGEIERTDAGFATVAIDKTMLVPVGEFAMKHLYQLLEKLLEAFPGFRRVVGVTDPARDAPGRLAQLLEGEAVGFARHLTLDDDDRVVAWAAAFPQGNLFSFAVAPERALANWKNLALYLTAHRERAVEAATLDVAFAELSRQGAVQQDTRCGGDGVRARRYDASLDATSELRGVRDEFK